MAAIEEQETTITISRDSGEAVIWTSDLTMMTKLDRLCSQSEMYECTETAKNRSGELISKSYRIKDKKLISFRSARPKRILTDEQKELLIRRLKESRIS